METGISNALEGKSASGVGGLVPGRNEVATSHLLLHVAGWAGNMGVSEVRGFHIVKKIIRNGRRGHSLGRDKSKLGNVWGVSEDKKETIATKR